MKKPKKLSARALSRAVPVLPTLWLMFNQKRALLNLLPKPDTQTSEDVGNCVQPIKREYVYGRQEEDKAFLLR